MLSEPKTASKEVVNVESRSRIRKRKALIWSPRSVRRLRAAWVGPRRGRVCGHAEQVDPPGVDFHHEQNVKAAQRDGVEGEEVGGQQPGGLSAEEGSPPGVCPAGCWTQPGSSENPADSAGAHAVPESGEFAVDAAVAPGGVLLCQA
jgi:hypothetical protein